MCKFNLDYFQDSSASFNHVAPTELCSRFFTDQYQLYNFQIVYKYTCLSYRSDGFQDAELESCLDPGKSLQGQKVCLEMYEKKNVHYLKEFSQLTSYRLGHAYSAQVKMSSEGLNEVVIAEEKQLQVK